MQSKGVIKLLAILLAIACIYQLSFSLKARSVEKKAATWTFTAMYASIRLCSITASIHASFLAISLTSYAP